ncbi:phosphate/phosphite/phosphonate ABC transporter substrate-binding protein [Reinekea marinisedimentorum]|uniref:Phosphonate transport system substrate-binding protein n=1 Tax=Reinekea marinisedimentorum TaxID=230495 RepID=A0A4R3I5Q3_9GAMM|nr:phosphate/phosphite/phosphonate ABC transporter substrate-binding protein [Reinekea marinisedimentorum]TCS41337.1 phosphonate transport system substrate-binding protein [Reinekea marinisedimentorum]
MIKLMNKGFLALLLAAAFLAPCFAKDTLVIGKVTTNPKKHYDTLRPIVDYAVARMGDLGITEGKVLMAKDNEQMIEYLKTGQVDWVTETIFSSIEFEEQANAELLVRKWKKGVPNYHTIFFTRKDSGIDTLEQLAGHTIAFEDEGSTSAYFIPAAVLLQNGQTLTAMQRPNQTPDDDSVGYIFSGAEINTSTWVHKKIVSAGAYNNLDWDKEDHLPPMFRDDFQIIHTTPSIPRAVEVVSGSLDPAVKERLKEILLTMHEDPEAADALDSYQKTSKMDELTPEIMANIEQAREIRQLILHDLE